MDRGGGVFDAELPVVATRLGDDVPAAAIDHIDPVQRQIGEPDDAFEHRLKQLGSRAEYEKRTANGRIFLLKTGLREVLAEPPAKRVRVQARPSGETAGKRPAENAENAEPDKAKTPAPDRDEKEK